MWKKPCRELEEEREEEFSNKYVLNCVKQEGLTSGKKNLPFRLYSRSRMKSGNAKRHRLLKKKYH